MYKDMHTEGTYRSRRDTSRLQRCFAAGERRSIKKVPAPWDSHEQMKSDLKLMKLLCEMNQRVSCEHPT